MNTTKARTTSNGTNGNNGPLIEGLNDALNREITTVIRYIVQGSTLSGRENEPLRQIYRADVGEEIGHTQYLADKIAMLGGAPSPRPAVKPSPVEVERMVDADIAAEQDDVIHYRKLAKLADDAGDIDLKLRMEQQAADEERHAEQLRRLRV